MMGPPTRSASATAGERRFRLSPSLALTAAIPLIYVIVFAVFLVRTGDTDWDQILSFHELSLWNGKLAGPAKQWNPLMRGGMSLAGDPQVPIFSPSMILARVIDPAAAIKISCLLFLGLGALGAWLLARDFRLNRRTSALAAALFAGNGYILSRFSHGHVVFLGTLGLPLWLWAARRSLPAPGESKGPANRRLLGLVLAGGAFFALSTDGAPIAILLLLVWIGLDTMILSWQKRSPRPLVFFAGSVLLAAALDAVYYFPMAANAMLPKMSISVDEGGTPQGPSRPGQRSRVLRLHRSRPGLPDLPVPPGDRRGIAARGLPTSAHRVGRHARHWPRGLAGARPVASAGPLRPPP